MSLFKNLKNAFRASVAGTAGYGGFKAYEGYQALKEHLGDWTLPAVATAAAGVIGGVLGKGRGAGLAMALTMGGFALDHISNNGGFNNQLTAQAENVLTRAPA